MATVVDPAWLLKTIIPTSTHPRPTQGTVVPNVPIYQTSGDTGGKTLWVVFVLMLISSVSFFFLGFRIPVQKRLFHVITASITTIATLSYFAMATGSGTSYTHIVLREHHKHDIPDTFQDVFRQVYWARYVDWTLTTPLLLLDLSFLAGISGANIVVAIFADVIMILTGLFAAFSDNSRVRWGWYTLACIAYLFIVYILIVSGRRTASQRGSATSKLFASIGGFTLVLWTLYPIVWGIADGARLWSVDTEIVAYAILDVLAKPVFGFWLLVAHGNNAAPVEGFWTHGLAAEGGVRLDDDEA